MTDQILGYSPPTPGVPYHLLAPDDPAVMNRVKTWAFHPTAFCREAMNWQPHWYQEELINDMSLFIAACWSRQIGKSEAIAHKAIHEAFTSVGCDILIVGPVQKQARELFEKIVKAIKSSPLIFNSIEGKMTKEMIRFDNGSRIINLAAGDDGFQLRGYAISLLIMEEAAFIPDAVYVAVEQALSSTGGREILISTPYGKHNEFYRTFHPDGMRGYDHVKKGKQQVGDFTCYVYDFTVGLEVQKPNGKYQLSQPHIDRQKRKLPKHRWLAEYEADFIEDIDQYYPQDIIDRLFNNHPQFNMIYAPEKGKSYYGAIDIAKGGNYTSVSFGELIFVNPQTGKRLENPHLKIVYRIYWKMKHIGAQYPEFIKLCRLWKPIFVFFDKTAIGERPFEELTENYGLPLEGVTFTGKEKVSMYGNMSILMSMEGELPGWNARVQSYVDEEAKQQYEAMVYHIPETKINTGAKVQSETFKIYAAKGYDDICDSDALLTKCMSFNVKMAAPTTVTKTMYKQDGPDDRDARVQKSMAYAVKGSKGKKPVYHKKVFWK